MARGIDWESQIGQRLRLRDLHAFFTVVQLGSMAKAAQKLGVSQPAISKVIADLEHAVGVQLLDRSPKGVEPTSYGDALLKRGLAAFDELKQGIRDIKYLADPTAGEVKIGCPESIAIVPPILKRLARQYPRIVVRVDQINTATLEFTELRERKLDLLLARLAKPITEHHLADDDLNVEILFDDAVVVAAAMRSKWARRRKIELIELVDASWILTPPGLMSATLEQAFRASGLEMPKIGAMTFSVHLRAQLLAASESIAAFPRSWLRLNADHFSLKMLPISLPSQPWPVAIVTLKSRRSSPVVALFIEQVRAFTNSMAKWSRTAFQ